MSLTSDLSLITQYVQFQFLYACIRRFLSFPIFTSDQLENLKSHVMAKSYIISLYCMFLQVTNLKSHVMAKSYIISHYFLS